MPSHKRCANGELTLLLGDMDLKNGPADREGERHRRKEKWGEGINKYPEQTLFQLNVMCSSHVGTHLYWADCKGGGGDGCPCSLNTEQVPSMEKKHRAQAQILSRL